MMLSELRTEDDEDDDLVTGLWILTYAVLLVLMCFVLMVILA